MATASMDREKFPKIPHLPFSLAIHSDDRVISTLAHLVNAPVVVTEKLDGANTEIFNGGVYARSALAGEVYSYIKNVIAPKITDMNLHVYGENMYAIHSIEYERLPNYFFVFAIQDNNDDWLSWEEIKALCEKWGVQHVPEIFLETFNSEKEMQNFMEKELLLPSAFGTQREGFVIRTMAPFTDNEFSTHIAKFVRRGHVQTDKHWTKNWKKAKIKV